MKGFRFLVQAVVVLLVASVSAQAYYEEIQCNAVDYANDATYINQVLTYSSVDQLGAYNILSLIEDTGPLTGFAYNVSITLSSTFQDYGVTLPGNPRAYFQGGMFDLTFWYSPTLQDAIDGIYTSHQLKGAVTEGSLEIGDCSASLSELTGVFRFDTTAPGGVENLPGSGDWPAVDVSTAVALTFAIGADLSYLKQNVPGAWDQDINEEDVPAVLFDTQFQMFPNGDYPIPEPASASLLLIGLGSLLVMRRRS